MSATFKLEFSKPEGFKKQSLVKLAKALIALKSGKYLSASVQFYEAFDAYMPANPSREQRAAIFWRKVLLQALTNTLGNNQIADLLEEELIKELEDTVEPIFSRAKNPSYLISHLSDPAGFPLYQELRKEFPDFIARTDPEASHSADQLGRLLDQSIRAAIFDVWTDATSSDFRNDVEAATTGPVLEGLKHDQAWQSHAAWVDHEVTSKPLFGQEKDSGITLRKVFTPLRCAYHEYVPVTPAENEDEDDVFGQQLEIGRHKLDAHKTRRIAHVAWLEDCVKSWLDADDKSDTLRAIAGGPGSGKSSFARLLAVDAAHSGQWHVAFVPLQHLETVGDLKSRLEGHFEHERSGAGLGFSPLDSIGKSHRRILFVFDGLDEIAREDDRAEKEAQQFITNVSRFLGLYNQGLGVSVKALVLGRSSAVASAFKDAGLPGTALLHVMPLIKLNAHCLQMGNDESELPDDDELQSGRELAEQDHRETYWDNWCRVTKPDETARPAALGMENLDDLTSEPLLFFLLIYSGYATPTLEEGNLTRNQIYKALFRRVHERDKKQKELELKAGIEEDDFFFLMECLGLAIWHGGGRTGSEADFTGIRKRHGGVDFEHQENIDSASLKNVAMQFYTRDEVDQNQGFEFIHKSFGEYLASCALLRISGRAKILPMEQFAELWLKLAGPQQVTEWMLPFLRDELRQLNINELEKLKVRLTKVLNWVIVNGLPAHRLGTESWLQAQAFERNARLALVAVLNAIAILMGEKDKETLVMLDWSSLNAPRHFLESLHATTFSETVPRAVLGYFFWGVKESNANLQYLDLFHSDLRGANLNGADLSEAHLNGTDLSEAKTSSANFSDSLLVFADFTSAQYLDVDSVARSFGDASTQLPEDMPRPDHWPTVKIPEHEAYERWKKWLRERDADE